MAYPTLQDVSKLAGTSDATASMILNGSKAHKFRPQTREVVLRAARELGYVPQQAGQMLRTGKSYNIAMLLNDLGNAFFTQYASILQRQLLQSGYVVIPLETLSASESEDKWLNWLVHRNVDGLIDLQGMLHWATETYDRFASKAPLVIRTTASFPGELRGDVIQVDYHHGIKLLAEHLASVGCRRPGVLTVKNHVPGATKSGGDTEWTRKCRSAFDGAGIPIPAENWFAGGAEVDMQRWYEVARSLHRATTPIDSLIVHSAALMPAVAQGLADAGWTLGHDLAVATFDELPFLPFFAGGITTVFEPVEEIATQLVTALLSRISKPDSPGLRQLFPTEIIIRTSTTRFSPSASRQLEQSN